jgi:acetyl-CoA acetyltransferase
MAARAIRSGEGDVFIAGGVESMSRAPYSLPKAESGYPFGNLTAYDTALGWRYPNPRMEQLYGLESMGETAENIAALTGITREAQDRFTLESHRRALAPSTAADSSRRSRPVPIPQKKGDPLLADTDAPPRHDLGRWPGLPSFQRRHGHSGQFLWRMTRSCPW